MSNSITAPRMSQQEAEREFLELCEEEKAQALKDIYGKQNEIEETPQLLESALAKLRGLLEQASNNPDNFHYHRALERCPDHAQNSDFLLRFLRAEHFCEEKAKDRILLYWKEKVKLFGEDKSYHKLSLQDLNEDDLAAANFSIWVLPDFDKAGRGIILSMKPRWKYQNWKNMARWMWYVLEAGTENLQIQKNGYIGLEFSDGPFSLAQFDRKLDNNLYKIAVRYLPIRLVALHHCYDSKVYDLVLPFARAMMGKELRARWRIHPGFEKEIRFEKLEEMGIPRDSLPTCIGGTKEFDIYKWIEERRALGK